MMNLLDLYRDDIDGHGKVISVAGGKEYRGPCPVCGGTDRFGVWPQQNNGKGSFYCGRGSGAGNGCEIGGDAVEYLKQVRKYSFQEACECLGIEYKRGGRHLRLSTPVPPKRYNQDRFSPRTLGYPEDVVDPDKWHEHGMKFVQQCHEALLNRPTSIAYLMARGISMEMIKKHLLGFHAGETKDGKQYLPSFRPWPSWGLNDEKKESGKHRMLILPAGLVIPYIVNDRLHRLTIRLIKPDPSQPKKKYHYVRGSIRDAWMSNPSARAFVVQEAELDSIAVEAAAGDLVGTIGLGSTDTKPDSRAYKALRNAISILVAMDFDQPRLNERTGKMESPGATASGWWKSEFSQSTRWPVPQGKDAGEAFGLGVDLRTWILAGLPSILVPEERHSEPVSPPIRTEIEEEIRIEKILHDKKYPPTNEVLELKQLLAESDGFIQLYDCGNNLGIEVDRQWSLDNRAKRRRMTQLLYGSNAVFTMLCNLADGNYKAVNLPV
jgi:hypothetical protein